MRVKSNWFKAGEKSPTEVADAMAFIAWKIAQNLLKNLRRADFGIEVGPQYFNILGETLIFVVQISDRIVYGQLPPEARVEFITRLANRAAENLAENQRDLSGLDYARCKQDFIGRLNERACEYGECGYQPDEENFTFSRCFASALMEHLEEKDRHWVSDQVIAIEAPEAAATVEKSLRGLFSTEQRKPRAVHNGAE
jgi:hypothetical protein